MGSEAMVRVETWDDGILWERRRGDEEKSRGSIVVSDIMYHRVSQQVAISALASD